MLIFLETNMFQFQRKEVQIYNQEVRKNPVTIIWIITNSRLFFFNYPRKSKNKEWCVLIWEKWNVLLTSSPCTFWWLFHSIWSRDPFGLGPPGSLQVVTSCWIKFPLVLSGENISSFRIETHGSIQLWGDLSAVGNGTFHLRPLTPRDEAPAVISLPYEHTPALFNAAKFRMLVKEHG